MTVTIVVSPHEDHDLHFFVVNDRIMSDAHGSLQSLVLVDCPERELHRISAVTNINSINSKEYEQDLSWTDHSRSLLN